MTHAWFLVTRILPVLYRNEDKSWSSLWVWSVYRVNKHVAYWQIPGALYRVYRTKQQDILCTISQLVKCQCRYIRKKGNYVTCTWNGDSSVDDFENTRVKKIGGANQTSKGWLYFRRFDYYFRQRIGRESFLIFSNLLLWWEIVVLQIYFKFCIIKL